MSGLKKKLVVRGHCAVPGQVEGVVRIVESQEDTEKFKEGEIFVAFTSEPEMLAALQKAAAIVLDIGGTKRSPIQPAVVAQEVGIPCIVRTRTGSRHLKTGDRVLVDATKGNVYQIL